MFALFNLRKYTYHLIMHTDYTIAMWLSVPVYVREWVHMVVLEECSYFLLKSLLCHKKQQTHELNSKKRKKKCFSNSRQNSTNSIQSYKKKITKTNTVSTAHNWMFNVYNNTLLNTQCVDISIWYEVSCWLR